MLVGPPRSDSGFRSCNNSALHQIQFLIALRGGGRLCASAAVKQLTIRKGGTGVFVVLPDDRRVPLSAELLRAAVQSADVRGHDFVAPSLAQGAGVEVGLFGGSAGQLPSGKRGVRIQGCSHTGGYGAAFAFSDGHSAGVFSWPLLAAIASRRIPCMRAYVRALRAAGLARSPPPPRRGPAPAGREAADAPPGGDLGGARGARLAKYGLGGGAR